jgi:hypothetical protein
MIPNSIHPNGASTITEERLCTERIETHAYSYVSIKFFLAPLGLADKYISPGSQSTLANKVVNLMHFILFEDE